MKKKATLVLPSLGHKNWSKCLAIWLLIKVAVASIVLFVAIGGQCLEEIVNLVLHVLFLVLYHVAIYIPSDL